MNKILRVILISLIIAFSVFTYLLFSGTGEIPVYQDNIDLLLLSFIITVSSGVLIIYINRWLNKILFWQKSITKRFISGVLLNNLGCLLITLLLILLYSSLFVHDFNTSELFQTYKDLVIKLIIIEFFIIFIYNLIDFALYSYNQFAVVQIEAVKLNREQIGLQFQVLKSQLSPHYLFNSLNTISSLVYKSPELAEKFIRKLANTFQYIISTNDKNLIDLSMEIKFAKAYVFLLEVRFEKAVNVYFNIPEQLLIKKLPPLSIQMLIENAVKHNAGTKDNPLNINVFSEENNYVTVRNNIVEKLKKISKSGEKSDIDKKDSFGIGLNNIKKRYRFFTDQRLQIAKDKNYTVRLPLLTP